MKLSPLKNSTEHLTTIKDLYREDNLQDRKITSLINENKESISLEIRKLPPADREKEILVLSKILKGNTDASGIGRLLLMFQRTYPNDPKPVLRRQLSLEDVKSISSREEKELIAQKQGVLWECTGTSLDEFGGRLYTFKFRDSSYDALKFVDDFQEMIPAIEVYPSYFLPDQVITIPPASIEVAKLDKFINFLDESELSGVEIDKGPDGSITIRTSNQRLHSVIWNSMREKFPGRNLPEFTEITLPDTSIKNSHLKLLIALMEYDLADEYDSTYCHCSREISWSSSTRPRIDKRNEPYITLLGYKSELDQKGNVEVTFPDHQALAARWDRLRQARPELELAQLKITADEGIASDLDYANGLVTHDCLLSLGKEFVHDQTVHVLPKLRQMLALKSSDYSKWQARFSQPILKAGQVMALTERRLAEPYETAQESWKTNFIQLKEILEAVIGLYADVHSATLSLGEFKAESVLNLAGMQAYGRYFKGRFNLSTDSFQLGLALKSLWEELEQQTFGHITMFLRELQSWTEHVNGGDVAEAADRITNFIMAPTKVLDLSNLGLTSLPRHISSMLAGVQEIDLSRNNLDAAAVDLGKLQGLRTLDLSHNKGLQSLKDEKLPKSLRKLSVSYCSFTSMNAGLSFRYLKALKHLDISHNRVDFFPQLLNDMPKLITLNLSHNNMTEMQSCNYSWPVLKMLDLRGNNLAKLPWVLEHSDNESIIYRMRATDESSRIQRGFQLLEDPSTKEDLPIVYNKECNVQL